MRSRGARAAARAAQADAALAARRARARRARCAAQRGERARVERVARESTCASVGPSCSSSYDRERGDDIDDEVAEQQLFRSRARAGHGARERALPCRRTRPGARDWPHGLISPLETGASEGPKTTSLRKLLDFTASVRDTIGGFTKNTGYCV